MNDDKKHAVVSVNGEEPQPISSISQALGVSPILPGEDEELYRQGLTALIAELEAKTVLQVYLAEKIFDCLWWLRRYEEQKRATVLDKMASCMRGWGPSAEKLPTREQIFNSLLRNRVDDKVLTALKKRDASIDSIRQTALEEKKLELRFLDEQIALQTKILAGLQASFEVAFNRKLNAERLMLQNEILRRDLAAIDITPDESLHEKPKTSRRKPA